MAATYVRGGNGLWHESTGTKKSDDSARHVHTTRCGGTIIVGAPSQAETPSPVCDLCTRGIKKL